MEIIQSQLGMQKMKMGEILGFGRKESYGNKLRLKSLLITFIKLNWIIQHVKDGNITIERLDDAVRRILRVKLLTGIFQKGIPSSRVNAGNENLLGLPNHRVIARQAVRESMVLLKNNNQILPIDRRCNNF